MCFRPVEVAAPVICPQCGTKNANTAKKCFKCGYSASEASASGDAASQAASRPPSTKPLGQSRPGAPSQPSAAPATSVPSAPKQD